jgi:hypothetical protein
MSHAHMEKPADITVPATSLWAKLPLIGGVVAALGLGFTIFKMFSHDNRAMFSYLFAFMSVLSLALGALAFVLIQHATRAGWSAVVRRIGENAMATLPMFAVLFVPIILFGFHDLYPWSHETDEILERKRWWLGGEHGSMTKFVFRAVLFFGIWTALSQLLWRKSLSQDALAAGDPRRDEISRSMWKLSAGGIFLFALSQSFAAVDWLMSLQPHWYSTIYGVYYFAGSMVGFYSFLALVLLGLQKAGMLKTAVTTEHFHDVGKFMFGHTVFWAYIAFSQFILIWYANIPEETEFYMLRAEGGWRALSYAMPFVHFFIPFLYLVSRHVKRDRRGILIGALWLTAVHIYDLFWNVMPNAGLHGGGDHGGEHAPAAGAHAAEVVSEFGLHHISHFSVALTDITAILGMGGAFIAAFAYLLKKNNVICIGDPRLEESMRHENY